MPQDFDAVLKLLFRRAAERAVETLTGMRVVRWLDTEFPRIQAPRVDLLGETADGMLIHIELQSTNDGRMWLRMSEYFNAIYRRYGRAPLQVVLYVGREKMSMLDRFEAGRVRFGFELVDIRDLDGETLVASESLSDNILAILTGLRDQSAAIRRVLEKMAQMENTADREEAVGQLLTLAGLRYLEGTVIREAQNMPLDIDRMIRENKVLGPGYIKAEREGMEKGLQKGIEEGLQEGLQKGLLKGLEKGLEEGRREGELAVLRRVLEKKFGTLPVWADIGLANRSTDELETLASQIFDVSTLEELLQ